MKMAAFRAMYTSWKHVIVRFEYLMTDWWASVVRAPSRCCSGEDLHLCLHLLDYGLYWLTIFMIPPGKEIIMPLDPILSQLHTVTLYFDNNLWLMCTSPKNLYRFSYQIYEGVSINLRTGRLERELQMVQLSATERSCITVLWVSLVSFAAIILCVASQGVFIDVVYLVMTQSRNFWIHPRPTLGPTQPPIRWVPGSLSLGVKAAGPWSWPLASI
jgi:hypothetical protein